LVIVALLVLHHTKGEEDDAFIVSTNCIQINMFVPPPPPPPSSSSSFSSSSYKALSYPAKLSDLCIGVIY